MSVAPTGDTLSVVLVGILLACVIGLVAYVWVRLGRKKKTLEYRGASLHLNPALPTGKVVFIDAASQPIGETAFEKLDAVPLPQDCTGVLLSTADYASLLERQAEAEGIPATRRMQA